MQVNCTYIIYADSCALCKYYANMKFLKLTTTTVTYRISQRHKSGNDADEDTNHDPCFEGLENGPPE